MNRRQHEIKFHEGVLAFAAIVFVLAAATAAQKTPPSSDQGRLALAQLYEKTGRIRDAVLEAQDILKHDPGNLEAHKLLGKIYVRSISDSQGRIYVKLLGDSQDGSGFPERVEAGD
jgi:hypothetical protein